MDVSSSGLIDHLKCKPLLQHCNALIQPAAIFALRTVPSDPRRHHRKGVCSQQNVACAAQGVYILHPSGLSVSFTLHFRTHLSLPPPFLTFLVTTVLFPQLVVLNSLFQACFTFPLILLSVHPSVSFLSPSPARSLIPPPPRSGCAHFCLQAEKQIHWASTHWPEVWTWAQLERQKERTDEINRGTETERSRAESPASTGI